MELADLWHRDWNFHAPGSESYEKTCPVAATGDHFCDYRADCHLRVRYEKQRTGNSSGMVLPDW